MTEDRRRIQRPPVRDVTDLEVYQNALKLLRPIYRLARLIPQSHNRLRSQIINAAESIAPLIAEGFAKKQSLKELKRFLDMALGSSDEMVTHLRQLKILAESYSAIKAETCDALINHYKRESRQLEKMKQRWTNYK